LIPMKRTRLQPGTGDAKGNGEKGSKQDFRGGGEGGGKGATDNQKLFIKVQGRRDKREKRDQVPI